MQKPNLSKIPHQPGVYIMKDKASQVLYVGKAKDLKKRVSSYWAKPTGWSAKIEALTAKVARIDTMVVDNEVEALVLEAELIKQHRPPFNVVMRDDKSYLYIKVTVQDEFPRVLTARRVERDGAKYFGPFVEGRSVYNTVKLVMRIFPLCNSNIAITPDKLKRSKPRACLNYHLGICPGVCLGEVESGEYKQTIGQVVEFLNGRHDVVIRGLKRQMQAASNDKKFERAARLRDAIKAVEKIASEQKVVAVGSRASQDVVGVARRLNRAVIALWQIRAGKVVNQQTFAMDSQYENSIDEVVLSFLQSYYRAAPAYPKEIILSQRVKGVRSLNRWLTGLADHRVEIKYPERGKKRQLAKLADKNASVKFSELEGKWEIEKKIHRDGLKELAKLLNIKNLGRIEAYDISNTSGQDSVGSMVVFEGGRMNNQQYRRFKIKSVEGPNDFASLAEVLKRRFANSEQKFASQPDLIVIDGGKGQVNTVAKALGVKLGIIGFAKGSHSSSKAKDDIVLPFVAQPVVLANNSPAKLLLQKIRDEAHRFAIGYHTSLRRKRIVDSKLDQISGVGSVTRKRLIKKFGSVAGVERASLAQIAELVGEKKAEIIKSEL